MLQSGPTSFGTKKAPIMSELQDTEVIDEQVQSESPQLSTASAQVQQELPLSVEVGCEETPDSVSSSVEIDISAVVGVEQVRPGYPQSSTLTATMERELPIDAGGEESADSITQNFDLDSFLGNYGAARGRPSSPQPSTSSARVPLQPQPFVRAGDAKWTDPVSSGAQGYRSSFGESELRPWSPQPSTSSAGMVARNELQPFFESGDHLYALNLSKGTWGTRPWSPQPSTSSAAIQPFGNTQWTDSGSLLDAENIRSSLAWKKMRPRSPQPSTSTAAMMMQLELLPVLEGSDVTSTDSIYSKLAQNISAPLGGEQSRPWSPQPSTSSAIIQKESMASAEGGDSKPVDFTHSKDKRKLCVPVHKRLRRWSASSVTKKESQTLAEVGDGTLSDSDVKESAPIIRRKLRRWSPRSSSALARVQPEPQPFVKDTTWVDFGFTFEDEPISFTTRKEMKRPWSLLPPISTAGVMQLKLLPLKKFIDSKADSFSLSAKNISDLVVDLHPLSPQPSTLSAEVEVQPLAAGDEKPADSAFSSRAQNISSSTRKGKKRPWSPAPPTSTAAMMQLKLLPLKEFDSKADAFPLSASQNISDLVVDLHPLSPQPSTSSAEVEVQPLAAGEEIPADFVFPSGAQDISAPIEGAEAPAPQPPTSGGVMAIELPPVKKPDKKNPADSVYSHVTQNISNIPQLSGLKAGRRHGRLRRLNTQNKVNEKYGPVLKYIGPMVAEETAKQQTQQILIASALDHFANTINQIADKYEGTEDTTGFTERFEAFKKRVEDRREMRRKRNPNASEEQLPRAPSPPKLSEEEINRRLREETEAAVEALMTGDRSKECPPDRFAEIIRSFNEAFNPPRK